MSSGSASSSSSTIRSNCVGGQVERHGPDASSAERIAAAISSPTSTALTAGPRSGAVGQDRGVRDAEAVRHRAPVRPRRRARASRPASGTARSRRCAARCRVASAIQPSSARSSATVAASRSTIPTASPAGRRPVDHARRDPHGLSQPAPRVVVAQVAVLDPRRLHRGPRGRARSARPARVRARRPAGGAVPRRSARPPVSSTIGRSDWSTSRSPLGSPPVDTAVSIPPIQAPTGRGHPCAGSHSTATCGWSLERGADARRVDHDVDAGGPQRLRRSDAGAQQQHGGGERSRGEHDLVGIDHLAGSQLDAHRATAGEAHASDDAAASHGEVRASGRREEVGQRAAPAHAVGRVRRHGADAGRPLVVLVHLGREPRVERGADERGRGRVVERPAPHGHRAGVAVHGDDPRSRSRSSPISTGSTRSQDHSGSCADQRSRSARRGRTK